MSQHPPSHKWQRNRLREEDSPNARWDVGECVAHAADDDVLEGRRILDEAGLRATWGEVALKDKLLRKTKY